MKYIIIGLGNYGSVLAEELSALGHEVIGVDTNERRVDVLKDKTFGITAEICGCGDCRHWRELWRFHSWGGIIEKKRSETYLCACGG